MSESEIVITQGGTRYEIEKLPEDSWSDNGTMHENALRLQEVVVGHRIIGASLADIQGKYPWEGMTRGVILDLSNQSSVLLRDGGDCCAYTYATALRLVDTEHVITSVGTTEEFTKWFIYSENNPVLEMDVDWSCGNPFYYGYGFSLEVVPLTIVVDSFEKNNE